MGLINETNQQYYAASQTIHVINAGINELQYTFDASMKLYSTSSWSPSDLDYGKNNFIFEYSFTGLDPYTPVNVAYTVTNNLIALSFATDFSLGYFRVRLKETNYGDYAGVSLKSIVNNFIVAYIGEGKIIPSAKRTDVIFHAKRGMQEFSYDTLKSIKQQELSIPNTLSVILPQDYVNYVKLSWVDDLGVKHIIYPTRLTSNPTDMPIQQGDNGVPIQDEYGSNLQGTPIIEERWGNADDRRISGSYYPDFQNAGINEYAGNRFGVGQRYGANPETSTMNGWFTVNEREGKISFSSNLVGRVIIFEYISDGLAYEKDMHLPKLAEEAMYAHIAYSILSVRANVPEYIVQRFKRDRSAKLRNTKIRLSNIKLEEITQVMRNKSKWIKH
tara:strand:+ start:2644 stop:3807 length:1164 start_codon:yes stop_codon:yes gene_type:complete